MKSHGKYIPAGCLRLACAADLPDGSDLPRSAGRWVPFHHPDDPGAEGRVCLSPDVQGRLLRSGSLAPFSQLFRKRWIRLELCSEPAGRGGGVCRVFLLPDDTERRAIPRSDPKRRKELQALLLRLDYSKALWADGVGAEPAAAEHDPGTDAETRGSESLLQMFNNIPSPSPQGEADPGSHYFQIFHEILAGKISGLRTPLYGYQSRSAALMLQREYLPGTVADPRLVGATDHDGGTWYHDDVTGEVVRLPRHYDGVRGGILAEEMGAGKTLICLALILATKAFPAETPDFYKGTGHVVRPRVGSLVDMAAATITRESVPWTAYFRPSEGMGVEHTNCVEAIRRNPGYYLLRRPAPPRESRRTVVDDPPAKIYLSSCSLVLVPTNLARQWRQEIEKHTTGLKVLSLTGKNAVPPALELADYDVVLCSLGWFERLKDGARMARTGWALDSPLAQIQFKRVIVDEGHRLGNARMHKKSDVLLMLECLQVSARWIVTGTPSTGLFGVDASEPTTPASDRGGEGAADEPPTAPGPKRDESSGAQERNDLERIGAMAALFLKMRPWANTARDGDAPADWKIYVMQPRHGSRSRGREEVLRSTLDSLIIRHRRSDIGELLPAVREKVVLLDGCFQDRLSLNLFAMMIVLNAVQSERKDQDYFFHPKQRSALLQLVSNMRQSSFYGGYFYPDAEIRKALETAEKFLEERKVAVTGEDQGLLRDAMALGRYALDNNHLRTVSDHYHEVPLYVEDFPGDGHARKTWSLDGGESGPVCTAAPMLLAMQRLLRPCVDAPHSLRILLDGGRFASEGGEARTAVQERRGAQVGVAGGGTAKRTPTLAGNTNPGEAGAGAGDKASPAKRRAASLGAPTRTSGVFDLHDAPVTDVAEPLAGARIVSTASAKLSYLLDAITRHQGDEQILVFYDNDNVAFYLAEHLEVLQVPHLIYAKGITAERRAQYVDTFNHNPKFRVLLMDVSQAAFGLNLQAASRIYFVNPVLNPQVEAQAIGRVRRISQKRQVTVETLVLRGSVEEVIVERRRHMTQAEHRRMRSLLDDRPLYDWILNARVRPMPGDVPAPIDQTSRLAVPQFLFGRGFGRVEHPDEGLVVDGLVGPAATGGLKRRREAGQGAAGTGSAPADGRDVKRRKGGVRFAGVSEAEPVSGGVARWETDVHSVGGSGVEAADRGVKRLHSGQEGGPASDADPQPERPKRGVRFFDGSDGISTSDGASDEEGAHGSSREARGHGALFHAGSESPASMAGFGMRGQADGHGGSGPDAASGGPTSAGSSSSDPALSAAA